MISCFTSAQRRWTSAGSSPRSLSAGWRGQPRWSTRSTGSGISTSETCSGSSTGPRTRPGRPAEIAVSIGDEDPAFAGGSYVIVQKYLHDMAAWDALSVEEQERVIGRTKLSNVEMDDDVKPSNSHVALNTIIDPDGTQRQILRENMPFGSLGAGEFGTYFIGYAATPSVTELMLQRMFLGDPPGNYDRILDFSTAVTGGLFFVPTADFLDDPPALPDGATRRRLRGMVLPSQTTEVSRPLLATARWASAGSPERRPESRTRTRRSRVPGVHGSTAELATRAPPVLRSAGWRRGGLALR